MSEAGQQRASRPIWVGVTVFGLVLLQAVVTGALLHSRRVHVAAEAATRAASDLAGDLARGKAPADLSPSLRTARVAGGEPDAFGIVRGVALTGSSHEGWPSDPEPILEQAPGMTDAEGGAERLLEADGFRVVLKPAQAGGVVAAGAMPQTPSLGLFWMLALALALAAGAVAPLATGRARWITAAALSAVVAVGIWQSMAPLEPAIAEELLVRQAALPVGAFCGVLALMCFLVFPGTLGVVRGVVAELLARGAGEVIVMEQAGIEHVRHLPDGRRYGSTREVLSGNGLLAAIEDSGASALFLDDLDFEEGFMAASPPEGSAWGPRMFLPKALEDVDHVVYLPRLGSHLIAGYTVGLKNGVGWLREDSRFVLHNDAAAFYQTTADINYVAPLRSRLRLVLTLADRALLHMGPDDGTVHELDPRVVLASSSLANHDALAVGLLTFFNATVALDPALPAAYSQDTAPFMNRLLVDGFIEQQTGLPWGETVQAEHDALIAHAFEAGVLSDRCLARAWELEGGRPTSIRVAMMGVAMIPALRAHLEAHGEGLFGFG